MPKSGFVGVLGQTNVGKSSFINAVLGRKLLIVSHKFQSTRNRIRCIYNDPGAQIVLVDTPGLHKPVDRLSSYLLRQAFEAIRGLDLVLYMVEPWISIREYDRIMFEELGKQPLRCFLLINKVDRAQGNQVVETIRTYWETGLFEEVVPISCATGINVGKALDLVKEALPEGPRYFPEDVATDREEEFVISEFIREKVYELTREEVPYSVFVEVVRVDEREENSLIEVYANIHVARESQKGILVGEGGRMIKEIGRLARQDIEALLGAQVYLDLHIKVTKKWNQDEAQIGQRVGAE